MAIANSTQPETASKAQGAATATAAAATHAAMPAAAKAADTAVKPVEAPAKKAEPVQPAAQKQPAKAEVARAAPAKPAPARAAKPAPVRTAKPAPAGKPRKTAAAAKAAAPATSARKRAETARTNIKSTVNNATQTGAKTMNQTMKNSQEATQQAAKQATEQFRGAIEDANQRGQAVMEKSSRMVEEMADLTRGNMEAFVASSKTAAKYVETLTQGAADYNRRSFEQASATLRSFAEVKSPTDFFRLQSDYARSAFDSMISESARVSETMVKMTGEVAEPITSRYSVAAERLKAVAA